MAASEVSLASKQKSSSNLLVGHVRYSDLMKLSYDLLSESVGTRFQNTAGKIAKNWLGEIKRKQESQLTLEKFLNHMETIQPNYRLIVLLTREKRAFIDQLFGMDTTQHVLSTKSTNNLIVISKTPTTANVFEYSAIYSDALIAGCEYFDFMVHGENEVDEKEYTKITKDEWNAFGR